MTDDAFDRVMKMTDAFDRAMKYALTLGDLRKLPDDIPLVTSDGKPVRGYRGEIRNGQRVIVLYSRLDIND